MKAYDSLIRLRKFEVDESRQKVAEIEAMIMDFRHMADDLDRQVQVEQQRAGVFDVNDCHYPLWAKDAIKRKKRLMDSVKDLEAQLDRARESLAAAFEELKKVEKVGEREVLRHQDALDREEASELDEIGASRHHRGM